MVVQTKIKKIKKIKQNGKMIINNIIKIIIVILYIKKMNKIIIQKNNKINYK